jgi:hypothetical protein
MRITWEVEDGYAGKSRPQFTDIDDDDLADCETEEEKEDLINSVVQDDFEQNITWGIIRTD